MSIIPRPLKSVLGKIIPFSINDKVPTFNLGSGTPIEDDILAIDVNGDAEWIANPSATIGDVDLLKSTGVLTGGVVSIGTGGAGVATTFTIAAGTGIVTDNTVNPTTSTNFSWSQFTDVAITNLATQTITYVAIDYNGGAPQVVQSTTDWTPSQFRQYIEIGVVVHANYTVVNAVNQMQAVAYNPLNQLQDLNYALAGFNISGNIFSANGANLKINKSVGSVFRQGSNYSSLTDNPHVKALIALTQAPLRMQNQTGAGGASVTDVDVNNYDLAGVTTAVPVNKFTILRIYSFVSNLIAVQRGQAYYNSLAEAKANIQLEPYVNNQVLAENGILRGFLCVQQGSTALNVATKATFLEAGKFSSNTGVGGLSVSTLQNAYDNSSDPEIVTDSTRGALSLKRGSAADTDDIFEVLNAAGTQVAKITGEGKAQFDNTVTIGAYALPNTDGTINQVLKTDGAGTVSWGTSSGTGSAVGSTLYLYNNFI